MAEHDINYPHEAEQAIRGILRVGANQGYTPGSWRTESFMHHLGKALGHIGKYLAQLGWPTEISPEDHLAHALCRLAMAVGVRDQDHGRVNGS